MLIPHSTRIIPSYMRASFDFPRNPNEDQASTYSNRRILPYLCTAPKYPSVSTRASSYLAKPGHHRTFQCYRAAIKSVISHRGSSKPMSETNMNGNLEDDVHLFKGKRTQIRPTLSVSGKTIDHFAIVLHTNPEVDKTRMPVSHTTG